VNVKLSRDQILNRVIVIMTEISPTDTDFREFSSNVEDETHRMIFRASIVDEFLYKDGILQKKTIEGLLKLTFKDNMKAYVNDLGFFNFEVRVTDNN
jgi:hypothetical protein